MKVHIVGLPHTTFSKEKSYTCAYTSKTVTITQALRQAGVEVEVYVAGDDYDEPATAVMHKDARDALFGEWVPGMMPDVDWENTKAWGFYCNRVIKAISERLDGSDVIMLSVGISQLPIAQHFVSCGVAVAELGIGYTGVITDIPHCFESYAWRHHVYGKHPEANHPLDTVIGNPVDEQLFMTGKDQGYALYLGRVIRSKGIERALQWANACGLVLKVAGPGVAEYVSGRKIITDDGVTLEGDVEYIGPQNPIGRRKALAGASVLMVPTHYIGPWEGVHAEALMSGVMPVVPDLGAFVETMPAEHRFRDDRDGIEITQRAIAARSPALRKKAIDAFGMKVSAAKYIEWVERIKP